MENEQQIEQEIKDKGLTAPRITPADLDAVIEAVDYHVFPKTMLTVCCLTLKNGFTVTGESACVSPANFNAELGQKIAFGHARDKIWPLLGYALRDKLYLEQRIRRELEASSPVTPMSNKGMGL